MSTMCVHLSSASSGGLSFTKIIGFIKRWLGSKEMLLFLLNFEGTLVRSLWIDTSGDCGRGLLRPLDCPSLFFSAVLASSLSFTAAAWIAASRSMSWNRRRSDWWVLLYYLLEFYYYWILLFNGNKMNNAGTLYEEQGQVVPPLNNVLWIWGHSSVPANSVKTQVGSYHAFLETIHTISKRGISWGLC